MQCTCLTKQCTCNYTSSNCLRPVSPVRAADRYVDRPLSGGIAKIGCRRSIKGEIDYRRSIEEEKGKRKKKKKKRKRRKKKKRRRRNTSPACPSCSQVARVPSLPVGRPCALATRAPSSPACPRRLRTNFLPARGERSRRRCPFI
ncbi:hypothetical protein BHM03_00035507 [Ensete ventricosum]|nr:hypothetical protein BHM03_00035507 [Ensete ventricosum]